VNVRVPNHVLLLGVVVGGIAGAAFRLATVKGIGVPTVPDVISTFLVAAATAVFALLLLTRRGGVQSAVVVGDFLGALLFGALAGFAGQSALSGAFGTGPLDVQAPATVTPSPGGSPSPVGP
jgi:hypothetical protein